VTADRIVPFAIPIGLVLFGCLFLLGIDPIGNRLFRKLKFRRGK
jgi:hypothetical protein